MSVDVVDVGDRNDRKDAKDVNDAADTLRTSEPTSEVARIRQLVLRSWTMSRQHEDRMTLAATQRWEQEKKRKRGQAMMREVLGAPVIEDTDTGWKPFQTLLAEFEEAVRQDERAAPLRIEGR